MIWGRGVPSLRARCPGRGLMAMVMQRRKFIGADLVADAQLREFALDTLSKDSSAVSDGMVLFSLGFELVVQCAICPMFYLAWHLPLLSSWMPWEAWVMYTEIGMIFPVIWFSRSLAFELTHRVQSFSNTFLFASLMLVLSSVVVLYSPMLHGLKTAVYVTLVLLCLSFPVVLRVLTDCRNGEGARCGLWHLAGIANACMPFLVAVAVYYAMHNASAGESAIVAILLSLVAMPLVVQGVGNWIWRRAAARSRGWSKTIWVFYLEMIIASIGISLCSRDDVVLLAYSTSFAFSLLGYIGYGCLCSGNQLGRLSIFLEGLMSFVARLAALVSLLLVTCVRLALGAEASLEPIAAESRRVARLNFRGKAPVSGKSATVCLLALVIICSEFALFCVLLPRAWRWERSVGCRLVRCSRPPLPQTFDYIGPAAPVEAPRGAEDGVAVGRTAWADDSLVESWWLDTGSVRRTLIRYCALMAAFLREFRTHSSSTILFVLRMTPEVGVVADRVCAVDRTTGACSSLFR